MIPLFGRNPTRDEWPSVYSQGEAFTGREGIRRILKTRVNPISAIPAEILSFGTAR